jgi:hypothetical protein
MGARSEAQVHRVLRAVARDGWQVHHAIDWKGRGDLDHIARSPSGIGFVIETKTQRYTRAHVIRTVAAARWLARRRRRYDDQLATMLDSGTYTLEALGRPTRPAIKSLGLAVAEQLV